MKTLIKSMIIVALSCTAVLAEDTPDTSVDKVVTVDISEAPQAKPESASASQMAGIWHSMRWAKTESGRLSVLKAVAKSYWLSVMQLEVLLETISDRNSRATMLGVFYPKITNPDQLDRLKRLLPEGVNPHAVITEGQVEETAQL